MATAREVSGITADLRHYLQQARDSLVRTLDGLGDHDARRPLVPSGTNLLGLVKHVSAVEADYLGDCVGRPCPVPLPWAGEVDGSDMWATPDEPLDRLVGLYRDVWAHSDASLAELPLDAPASVPWWPPERRATTFGHLLVRVVAETAQHAGHAEIVRELIDGRGGRDHDAAGDADWWSAYVARIQAAADTFR